MVERRTSAAVARRRFGVELTRLRGQLRQADAAKALGWAPAKLRYLEAGTRPMQEGDLPAVFRTYDVPDGDQPELRRLCAEAGSRGWWDRYSDADLSAAGKRYMGLEHGATRIRGFAALLVPGLLQTPEYATEILRASLSPRAVEQVNTLIEIRRARQQALTADDPLGYWAILDEAALHRRVGSTELMRRQLAHIAEVAASSENVTVQVVPFEAGPHPGLGGPFFLFEFGWDDDPGLVYLEPQSDRTTYLEDRRDVYTFSQAFERLVTTALPPEDSLDMLRRMATP